MAAHMPDMDGLDAMGDPPTSPALDVGAMRQRMGDDEELIADGIRIFLEDCPPRLAAIASAIEARDPARIRAAAPLKGGASNLAAPGVVQAALALEAIGGSGDLALADARFATLVAETERLAAALRELPARR